MKKFFARYDVDTVCSITGAPKEVYRKVCDIFTSTWAPDRVGTVAVRHGHDAAHPRHAEHPQPTPSCSFCSGNVGMAGGGVNAMRGESNVQGSTDMGLLFHSCPATCRRPATAMQTLADYLEKVTPKSNDPLSANWWQNYPQVHDEPAQGVVGRARDGRRTSSRTPTCPKSSGNYSYIALFEAMHAGKIKGLFCFGQNPAVGGPNSNKAREALGKLDWMVAVDLFETDTSVFWKRPGVDPSTINTEVFLLPAAASVEKEGSVANSGRWAQWRYKAVDPPGRGQERRLDRHAGSSRDLKKAYAAGGAFPDPIRHLTWDYGRTATPTASRTSTGWPRRSTGTSPRIETIDGKVYKAGASGAGVRAAAGRRLHGLRMLDLLRQLSWSEQDGQHDGAAAEERPGQGPVRALPELGLVLAGQPPHPLQPRLGRRAGPAVGSEARRSSAGTPAEKKGGKETSRTGPGRRETSSRSSCGPRESACLFATALADGPFPEHYEPVESPVRNLMSPRCSTTRRARCGSRTRSAIPASSPIVATTYRVSEHWQAGAMTRNMPWLVELVPDVFVEMSPDLARRKGIETGDWVRVRSKRGRDEGAGAGHQPVRALLRRRDSWWTRSGSRGTGATRVWPRGQREPADRRTSGIANTMIPEFKAFLCDVAKA